MSNSGRELVAPLGGEPEHSAYQVGLVAGRDGRRSTDKDKCGMLSPHDNELRTNSSLSAHSR